jgi:hypothetical protein
MKTNRWMTILLVAVTLTAGCTKRREATQPGGDTPRHAEETPSDALEATIATPSGDVKISDIRHELSPFYISRIVLYPAPQRVDGRETVIDDEVYLVKADAKDPDWLQIARETGYLSWISASDVHRDDHYHAVDLYPDYYDNSFINALRIERKLIANQGAWRRKGPYLVTTAGKGFTFTDDFTGTGRHFTLYRIFDRTLSLLHVQYYEGVTFTLLDAATGILADGLLSEPQFSPGRTCFSTFGEFYSEGASIDIYEKDGNGYRLARRFEGEEVVTEGFSLESMVWLTAAQVRISLKSRDRGTTVLRVTRSERGDWQLKAER